MRLTLPRRRGRLSRTLGLIGVALGLALADLAPVARSQDWPRFRGPNGTGAGVATNLPTQWRDDDFAFRVRLPGRGHSSPVVFGSHLFLTAAAESFQVLAYDATTGARRWTREFRLPAYVIHRNNTLATATPAVDARHVFVPRIDGRDLVLTALTRTGEIAWDSRIGPFETQHGLGHSPIVVDDRVILADDQDLAGRVVAFEAATGRVLWEATRRAGRADYSTPCLFRSAGSDPVLLLNSGDDGIGAVSLRDGSLRWRAAGVLKMRSVSSPVVAGGLVFGTCGSGGGGNYLVAIRPPESLDDPPRTAYEIRRAAPYVPTPVVVGELLFLWSDAGIVSCVESASGKVLWQERVGGDYFASPVFADGKVINTSTRGEVVFLAASREYSLLGRNPLGEPGNATLAVASGRLYVRTLSQLVAIKPRPAS